MNEAERLAKELDEDFHLSYPSESMWKGAEELRRLSDINAELVKALEKISLFSMSQFSNAHDLASECIETAHEALEKAKQ